MKISSANCFSHSEKMPSQVAQRSLNVGKSCLRTLGWVACRRYPVPDVFLSHSAVNFGTIWLFINAVKLPHRAQVPSLGTISFDISILLCFTLTQLRTTSEKYQR